MDEHERWVIDKGNLALKRRPGTFHCKECWVEAAGLSSADDKQLLRQHAQGLSYSVTTTLHKEPNLDCEVCGRKGVDVFRVLA